MKSLKGLLSVCLLTFCLSLPVFGGHTQAGNWCPDGTPGCSPDGNGMVLAGSSQETPSDVASGTLLVLAALLMLLRYKA